MTDRQFGFIHDHLDIKILILFILSRLPASADSETLSQLTMCDDGVNYFDFADCLAELVASGHVRQADGGYAITEKGRANGSVTESSLPYSVRIKAEQNAAVVAAQQRRSDLICADHTVQSGGGCSVHLSMSDGNADVLDMHILVGSEVQAQQLEHRFRASAEQIYCSIMELLAKED